MRIAIASGMRLLSGKPHDVNNVRQARALADLGHQVTLLAGRPAGDAAPILEYYGCPGHPLLTVRQVPVLKAWGGLPLSSRYVGFSAVLAHLFRLRARSALDLVYVKSEVALVRFLLRFRRGLGVPIVFEVHRLGRWAEGPTVLPDEGAAVRAADGLVLPTKALEEVLFSLYPMEKPTVVAPLGTLPPEGPPRPWREEGPWRIFYAGQLNPSRGVEVLVEASRSLPGCEVHIVGGSEADVVRFRRAHGGADCRDRLVFHGFVAPGALRSLLEEADILALPYLGRGLMPYVAATKVYEYLSLGRPIVASDLPSIREALADGETALLVPPGDPPALVGAIRRLLADRALAQRLSERARVEAGRYTWEERARTLTRFFGSLLGDGRPEGRP